MPRKPSVRVQMTDDPTELDALLEAANITPPKRPGEEDPEDPQPAPRDPSAIPDDEPDDDELDDPNEEDTRSLTSTRPDLRSKAARIVEGEILPKTVRYEARISIVDAWQYSGTLSMAPDWVDRNWAAYAGDFDPVRNLEPGPALRVPTYRGDTVYARVGDYVARQEVRLVADVPGEIKIEVWEREQFERLFLPVKSNPSTTPETADAVPAAA